MPASDQPKPRKTSVRRTTKAAAPKAAAKPSKPKSRTPKPAPETNPWAQPDVLNAAPASDVDPAEFRTQLDHLAHRPPVGPDATPRPEAPPFPQRPAEAADEENPVLPGATVVPPRPSDPDDHPDLSDAQVAERARAKAKAAPAKPKRQPRTRKTGDQPEVVSEAASEAVDAPAKKRKTARTKIAAQADADAASAPVPADAQPVPAESGKSTAPAAPLPEPAFPAPSPAVAAAPLPAEPLPGFAAKAGSSFADPVDSELVEPENPLPPARLGDLSANLQAAAARAGWNQLTPVQARAIPYLRAKRDTMVQSRTGSGKTGAFLLPILERIDPNRPVCQALILVPTRELARQVAEEAFMLAGDDGIRTCGVYGGVGYGPQLEALEAGCHLVVGTPGRVLDHLLRRSLSLDDLDSLVFDEADRMLSMGFYPDMKAIQRHLPPRHVNAYMFSATYPQRVRRLAHEFLLRPGFLSLSADGIHISHIEHAFYLVPGLEKDRTLARIIEFENPASAIIFCNTKARVHYVATVLRRFGHNADELTSDLTQAAREQVLERLRNGTLRFLVATDLAARGLDVHDLACVVQYEPPEDPEAYVHRAGRTGRAGAGGVAIALVSPGIELMELRKIGKQFDVNFIERTPPTEADVSALVSQAMVATLEAKLRSRDRLEVERMRRFLPLVKSLADQGEDASAILAMLLDDYYHKMTHAPTPVPPAIAPMPTVQPEPRRHDAPRRDGDRGRGHGGHGNRGGSGRRHRR